MLETKAPFQKHLCAETKDKQRQQLSSISLSLLSLTLDHERLNHTVELRALVAEALRAGSELSEVLSSLGNDVTEKTEHNTSLRLSSNL